MWAERRSSQSTPSGTPPQSRPYSPASRRGTYGLGGGPGALPQRPGIHPRTSSLSLTSTPNASTTNLPTPARYQHGSSLRNELRNPTPEGVPDPLRVLQNIIGVPLKAQVTNGNGEHDSQHPAELVGDIDFSGLSLQAFVDRKGTEQASDVHSYTVRSIEECMSFLSVPLEYLLIVSQTTRRKINSKIYINQLPYACIYTPLVSIAK